MSDLKIFVPNAASDANVKNLCAEYGLWGAKFIKTNPYTKTEDVYIIAGLNDLSAESIDPEKIINRSEQNTNLFYPYSFAVKVDNKNSLLVLEELIEYCKEAEFISTIYKEFNVPLPEKIRFSELYYLKDFNEGRYNDKLPPDMRNKYLIGLQNYFRDESKTSKRYKEWRDYCRSEKYDEKASKTQRLNGYLKKSDPETDLHLLFAANGGVKKVEMQEHEYRKFREFMMDCYPDVTYHVSEKTIVDHGLIDRNNDDINVAIDTPWGRCVTGQKFAEILEKRFADEGFDPISMYVPSYWEYRNVFYKACDEKAVASAYNSIRLAYAKCDSLQDINDIGDPVLIDIPLLDFMNFVGLAKEIGLHFYIDNRGAFATPSLEQIHVVYPDTEHRLLDSVLRRMLQHKFENSHAVAPEQREFAPKAPLSMRIEEASAIKENADKSMCQHLSYEKEL